jgi:pimeloyl-ACP methyl ester carboxylesterase
MKVPEHVSIDRTRLDWSQMISAHIERVSPELLEADNAAANLPGYASSWNSMVDEILSETNLGLTYGLRPELKTLRPDTLFIWGDKDFFGPPTEGEEMAALALRAVCKVVTDAGHAVWIDQPEYCTQLVTEFIRALQMPSSGKSCRECLPAELIRARQTTSTLLYFRKGRTME